VYDFALIINLIHVQIEPYQADNRLEITLEMINPGEIAMQLLRVFSTPSEFGRDLQLAETNR
jgi:hypothetical protein